MSGGSDDLASEDNLDETELYKDVYLRSHLMDKEDRNKEKS